MLSKTTEWQWLLARGWFQRRCIIGPVEPVPQVSVCKQTPAQESHQIRQRPGARGFKLPEFDQQHRNQCCPNLNVQGVFRGADKGFNPQVLFDGLEKQLDLPAVLVDGPHAAGYKLQVIGHQRDRLPAFGISVHNSA